MTDNVSTIFIVGHRGSGKSTAARLAGEKTGLDVVDLDEVIEQRQGKSCADIIADSEARFRRLERETLAKLVEKPTEVPRIVSLGAGFHPLPDDGVCIWLYRDGWVEMAQSDRARLRPELDFQAEVAWMINEREPRWERAAHVRLDISRGRGPERTAGDLATWIDWLCELGDSPLAAKTWVVAADDEQLVRADRDARQFDLAGVEVRSDLVSAHRAQKLSAPLLASLRTAEPAWIGSVDAAAIDIDIDLLDDVLRADALAEMTPRPLLLSSHPPDAAAKSARRLVDATDRLARAYPKWDDQIGVKWAPQPADYRELMDAFDAWKTLRATGRPVTFLPQGERFGWCRPPLCQHNATNYIPAGLAPHRRTHTTNPVQTPLDLQAWLPHLAGPAPQHFEGLLGNPVRTSQGDLWHRRAARREDSPISYLKIPFGRGESTGELKRLLQVCRRLDVRGLSVTSPLKTTILDVESVHPTRDRQLSALNTLRTADDGWEATDTDQAGMSAALDEVERRGFAPGPIAIIGRGGVSPAVLRAIDESPWRLAHHASGRRGWTADAPDRVTMVVNAAGDTDNAYDGAPACQVWFDLHYSGVRRPPESAALHLNGDIFFDAQARAQRDFWYHRNED